jgi:hypothetical protein
MAVFCSTHLLLSSLFTNTPHLNFDWSSTRTHTTTQHTPTQPKYAPQHQFLAVIMLVATLVVMVDFSVEKEVERRECVIRRVTNDKVLKRSFRANNDVTDLLFNRIGF